MRKAHLFGAMSIALFLNLVILPLPAYSHAALSPRTSTQGEIEVYQVVAFTEINSPTTEIELIIPAGIVIREIEPTSGWTHTLINSSLGNASRILWKGTLQLGGQVELRFTAKNVGEEDVYAFKALQRYANGEVAEWDYAGMWVEVKRKAEILPLPILVYIAVGSLTILVFLGIILKRQPKRKSK
jgi:uncharacterized protein YcnI